MVLEHNDRLAWVGVTSSEASGTYAVEDAFELEMPTRVLGLDEAGEWLVMIAENEGVDHPVVSQMAMSRSLQGLAFVDEWCISVRKKKMSQLLLVHEMAHLVCANGGHGARVSNTSSDVCAALCVACTCGATTRDVCGCGAWYRAICGH